MARKQKMDPTAVMAALEGAGRDLDLSELAGELLSAFGGAKALAHEFVGQFRGEKATPTAKSRMLETVMRILTAAAPKDDGVLGNLGQMTNQQLAQMLGSVLRKGGVE